MPKSDHELFKDAIKALKKVPLKTHHREINTEPHIYSDNHISVSGSEYLSYRSPGIQAKTFAKLKKGQYKPLASLDLHGKTKLESSVEVINFINFCISESIKYVLIIHGKSQNEKAILKSHVANLLKNNNKVLAFCSAKPEDGGTGALYVILKRTNDEWR